MKLYGRYQSPYVRRVAISMQMMGIPFEHDPVPVFDQPETVREFNPVIRIPTLVLDDGEALVESWAILDWLDEQAGDKRLTPASGIPRRDVMKATALALGTIDRLVWAAYEGRFHPKEKVHQPWVLHNEERAMGGFKWLDGLAEKAGDAGWLCGTGGPSQADVTAGIAVTFARWARPELPVAKACPALARFSARMEETDAFRTCTF